MIEKLSDYDIERLLDDAFVPYMIKCAQSGCQHSARQLASITAGYIRSGEPLPVSLRDFIAAALSDGGQGKSVDKALRLKGQKKTVLYEHQAFAHAVYCLIKDHKAENITEACEMVKKEGVTLNNGERIFQTNPERIRQHFYNLKYNKL